MNLDSLEVGVGSERGKHGVDLSLDALRQPGPVPTSNSDFVVTAPERTDFMSHQLAAIRLGVDDPNSGRGYPDVIDVPACARDQAIVKWDDFIAYLALDEGR